MADEKDLPIKVDIGLKAELKGEIPTEKVGNAVDAILDTFSPFTQGMGLIGDHLRFHREKVIIKIGELAKEKAKKEGLKINPIPPKFLVPFIEKASCEDIESELIEAWANLLNQAATNYDSALITFVQFLSEIGPKEAKILEEMGGKNVETLQMVSRHLDIYEDVNDFQIRERLPPNFLDTNKKAKEISSFLSNLKLNGPKKILKVIVPCRIKHETKGKKGGQFSRLTSMSDFYVDSYSSIDILKRNSLIEVYDRSFFLENEKDSDPFIFTIAAITPMGLDFLAVCQGISQE